MKNKDSITAFLKLYDETCAKADAIFKESNICQWEKNSDGTFSCITNRQNSKNRPPESMETDGCCIELCKNPREFSDAQITRRQHSKKTGCLVKSLKCKLHVCNVLIKMSERNDEIKKHIDALEALQKTFSGRYQKLWREIPYASAKAAYVSQLRQWQKGRL